VCVCACARVCVCVCVAWFVGVCVCVCVCVCVYCSPNLISSVEITLLQGHFFVSHHPSLLPSGWFDAGLPRWSHYSPRVEEITIFSNALNVSSAVQLKKPECSLLNVIMEENMRRDYPHSYSPQPAPGESSNDSNPIVEDFNNFGVYVLIAGMIVLVFGGYVFYQRKHGLTHQQTQRYLAVHGSGREIRPLSSGQPQHQYQSQPQARSLPSPLEV
jgi:hypothetical protein